MYGHIYFTTIFEVYRSIFRFPAKCRFEEQKYLLLSCCIICLLFQDKCWQSITPKVFHSFIRFMVFCYINLPLFGINDFISSSKSEFIVVLSSSIMPYPYGNIFRKTEAHGQYGEPHIVFSSTYQYLRR